MEWRLDLEPRACGQAFNGIVRTWLGLPGLADCEAVGLEARCALENLTPRG